MEPLLRFSVIGDAWRLYQRRWWTWSARHAHRTDRVSRWSVGCSSRCSTCGGRAAGAVSGCRWARAPAPCTTSAAIVVGGFFLGGMIRMANRPGPRWRAPDRGPVLGGRCRLPTSGRLGLLRGRDLPGKHVLRDPRLHRLRTVDVHDPADRDRSKAGHGRRSPRAGALLSSQWLTATVFHLVLSVVSSLGVIFCCVGILFTGPLYSLSIAILFHEFFEPVTPFHGKKAPVDPYEGF